MLSSVGIAAALTEFCFKEEMCERGFVSLREYSIRWAKY
jgi:hypothetical protein